MISSLHNKQSSFIYKILCSFVALTFSSSVILPPPPVFAQTILNLPVPGTMVAPSPGFMPVLMTGLTIHPDNPLRFDFIMDTGHSGLDINSEEFKKESAKLIKYFMASLTTPENELWVNLSPYEKDRMIAEGLGKTEMGRDMLAQDYLLKQLTASLMYPEEELGKEFWKRVYQKAREKFGITEIPLNTFNKIWIVPEDALVYEQNGSAFVIHSKLAVMLEEDYEALRQSKNTSELGSQDTVVSGLQSQVVREVLLPEITKEINEGKNFANLRQIFNALILATWYKVRLKESLLGKVYVNQGKTKGIDVQDKEINEKIYTQYLEAFKKGVYNYIREDYDEATQQIIPRKYFSGGVSAAKTSKGKWLSQALLTDGLVLGLTAFSALPLSAQEKGKDVLEGVGNQAGVTAEFVENSPDDVTVTVHNGKNVRPLLLAQAAREANAGRNFPDATVRFEGAPVDPAGVKFEGDVHIYNHSGQPIKLSEQAGRFFPKTPEGKPLVKDVVIVIEPSASAATAASPIVSSPAGQKLTKTVLALAAAGIICLSGCGGPDSKTPEPPPPTKDFNVNAAVTWMSDQINPKTNLIRSFQNLPSTDPSYGVTWIYNQAQAIEGYLAAGEVSKAKQLADGLLALQGADGAWFNAYVTDTGSVATKIFEQYTRWVGPNVVVGRALVDVSEASGDGKYTAAAMKLTGWLDKYFVDRGSYGYLPGGVGVSWTSTEHNMRAMAFYDRVGDKPRADLIDVWLNTKMYNPQEKRYYVGYSSGEIVNTDPTMATDVQYLGPLMAQHGGRDPQAFAGGIDWLLEHQTAIVLDNQGLVGIPRWLNVGNSLWFEGIGELVGALQVLGREEEIDKFLSSIKAVQRSDGSLPAAIGGTSGWPGDFPYSSVEAVGSDIAAVLEDPRHMAKPLVSEVEGASSQGPGITSDENVYPEQGEASAEPRRRGSSPVREKTIQEWKAIFLTHSRLVERTLAVYKLGELLTGKGGEDVLSKDIVRTLIDRLEKEEDPGVRLGTVLALGKIGGESAVTAVRDAMETDERDYVRDAARDSFLGLSKVKDSGSETVQVDVAPPAETNKTILVLDPRPDRESTVKDLINEGYAAVGISTAGEVMEKIKEGSTKVPLVIVEINAFSDTEGERDFGEFLKNLQKESPLTEVIVYTHADHIIIKEFKKDFRDIRFVNKITGLRQLLEGVNEVISAKVKSQPAALPMIGEGQEARDTDLADIAPAENAVARAAYALRGGEKHLLTAETRDTDTGSDALSDTLRRFKGIVSRYEKIAEGEITLATKVVVGGIRLYDHYEPPFIVIHLPIKNALQDEFGIRIPWKIEKNFTTVGDYVRFIEEQSANSLREAVKDSVQEIALQVISEERRIKESQEIRNHAFGGPFYSQVAGEVRLAEDQFRENVRKIFNDAYRTRTGGRIGRFKRFLNPMTAEPEHILIQHYLSDLGKRESGEIGEAAKIIYQVVSASSPVILDDAKKEIEKIHTYYRYYFPDDHKDQLSRLDTIAKAKEYVSNEISRLEKKRGDLRALAEKADRAREYSPARGQMVAIDIIIDRLKEEVLNILNSSLTKYAMKSFPNITTTLFVKSYLRGLKDYMKEIGREDIHQESVWSDIEKDVNSFWDRDPVRFDDETVDFTYPGFPMRGSHVAESESEKRVIETIKAAMLEELKEYLEELRSSTPPEGEIPTSSPVGGREEPSLLELQNNFMQQIDKIFKYESSPEDEKEKAISVAIKHLYETHGVNTARSILMGILWERIFKLGGRGLARYEPLLLALSKTSDDVILGMLFNGLHGIAVREKEIWYTTSEIEASLSKIYASAFGTILRNGDMADKSRGRDLDLVLNALMNDKTEGRVVSKAFLEIWEKGSVKKEFLKRLAEVIVKNQLLSGSSMHPLVARLFKDGYIPLSDFKEEFLRKSPQGLPSNDVPKAIYGYSYTGAADEDAAFAKAIAADVGVVKIEEIGREEIFKGNMVKKGKLTYGRKGGLREAIIYFPLTDGKIRYDVEGRTVTLLGLAFDSSEVFYQLPDGLVVGIGTPLWWLIDQIKDIKGKLLEVRASSDFSRFLILSHPSFGGTKNDGAVKYLSRFLWTYLKESPEGTLFNRFRGDERSFFEERLTFHGARFEDAFTVLLFYLSTSEQLIPAHEEHLESSFHSESLLSASNEKDISISSAEEGATSDEGREAKDVSSPVGNYYEVLGVARDAAPEEIKTAYRELAKKLHPDINMQIHPQMRKSLEEQFKEINLAYEILSNPKMRRDYDFILSGGTARPDWTQEQDDADLDMWGEVFGNRKEENIPDLVHTIHSGTNMHDRIIALDSLRHIGTHGRRCWL